jgi:hypothetical protein
LSAAILFRLFLSMKKIILFAIIACIVSACVSLETAPALTTADGYNLYPESGGTIVLSKERSPSAFDAWRVQCPLDIMTDKRECKLLSPNFRIQIYYGSSSVAQSICVTGAYIVKSVAQIRIDQNAPVSTDASGCLPASRILDQMTHGHALLVRFTALQSFEWKLVHPIHASVQDDIVSLDGLQKAIEVLGEARQGKLALFP